MAQIDALESQISTLQSQLKTAQARVLDLEIGNDALESASRTALASVQELKERYEKTLEKLAFAQEELERAGGWWEEVERMRGELRGQFWATSSYRGSILTVPCQLRWADANLEISVLRSRPTSASSTPQASPTQRPPPLLEQPTAEELAASLEALELAGLPASDSLDSLTAAASPASTAPMPSTPSPRSRSPALQSSPSAAGPKPLPSVPPLTPLKLRTSTPTAPSTPSAISMFSSVTSASVTALTDLLGKAKQIETRLAAARGWSALGIASHPGLTVCLQSTAKYIAPLIEEKEMPAPPPRTPEKVSKKTKENKEDEAEEMLPADI